MKRKRYIALLIIASALAFSLSGFFAKNRGKLNRLHYDKEKELRLIWRNYTVYKTTRGRNTIAILYKIKNNKKIITPHNWVEITTEAEIANSIIWHATNSAEILGPDGVLYGFLVYRSADQVSLLLIDENTLRLYYHYIRTSKD